MKELASTPLAGDEIYWRPGFYIFLTYPVGATPVFRVLYKFSKDNPDTVMLCRIGPVTSEDF